MSIGRLSSLSLELICLILNEINSTRDFYSFIRASSQIYAAFVAVKERHISDLLKRAVPAEVLRYDAQVTLISSGFAFPKYNERRKYPSASEVFLQFITNVNTTDFANHAIPLGLSIPLCTFQSAIEYLIEDFCSQSRLRQSHSGSSSGNWKMEHWTPLSDTELVRLQRAFYRYNTCRNMMRTIFATVSYSEHVYDQFAEFLSAFSSWEAEEIGCVHDYILRRLDQVTEQLEEEFIHSVVDADQKIKQDKEIAEQASQSVEARLQCMSRILHPEAPEDHHFLGLSQSLFDEDRPEYYFSIERKDFQRLQMESLPTLGAPFLRAFFESSSKAKLELISKYGGTWSCKLDDALEKSYPSGRLFSVDPNAGFSHDLTTFMRDSAGRPNQAWIWAAESNPKNNFYRPSDYDLRALGYVFWDTDRLQKMRFMEEPRPKMRWSVPPDSLGSQRCHNPSAEQRLRDMGFVLHLTNEIRPTLPGVELNIDLV